MVSSKEQRMRMHTMAHTIGPPHPSLEGELLRSHNKLRSMAAHYRARTRGRTKTAGKKGGGRTSTRGFYKPSQNKMDNDRAPEVCAGLSPQQVNAIKVDLVEKLVAVNGPPPHAVLFRTGPKANADTTFGKYVVGVTMEDTSPKGNPHAVVATSGLVSCACPAEVAKKFEWGDFVAVCDDLVVASGFDRTQKIAVVHPSGTNRSSKEEKIIGRFAGWPTGNHKDGGVLVLLSLPC